MSDPIVRPIFFEGQILAANDLTAVVEHPRGEAARDRRSLHTPGIATGLVLSGKERKTAEDRPYQEVTLSAGVAVDRTGRQIVLPDDTRLDETAFDEQRIQVPAAEAWYPVFLRGVDVQVPGQPGVAGGCGATGETRVTESAEIVFGRPGDELDTDAGEPPEPADGPGNPSSLVLVGFVQWDRTLGRFKKVDVQVDGIGPRYVGALADQVLARADVLSLRSGEGIGKPILVLDASDGGHLFFGPQDARGRVIPAVTVDTKGNIKTEGRILTAALPAGTVLVQSGVATDGVILPLPQGIDPKDVESGKVALQVHLTPRAGGKPPTADREWFAVPLECRLDEPSRRVLCLNRWFHRTQATRPPQDLPGACDYTVMATVPPHEEDQP